jgi:hypothetical protein
MAAFIKSMSSCTVRKTLLGITARISQLPRNIDPARFPHGNVEDDDIGFQTQGIADYSCPVGDGGNNLVALLFLKHLADLIEDARIVVGKEYRRSLHKPSLEGWRCDIARRAALTPSRS